MLLYAPSVVRTFRAWKVVLLGVGFRAKCQVERLHERVALWKCSLNFPTPRNNDASYGVQRTVNPFAKPFLLENVARKANLVVTV